MRVHRIWEHDVDEEWLRQRKLHLMASEIKGLVSDQNKLDERKIPDVLHARQFVKLYGEKSSVEVDTLSRGPAARGHWMEAPAIKEYMLAKPSRKVHLWDDKLIYRGRLGFSPDALDIPQVPGTSIMVDSDGRLIGGDMEAYNPPTSMVEVKSYDAGNHFLRMSMVQRHEQLDEVWQVAAAMVVCPSIERADLMFYAPQANSMFTVTYHRSFMTRQMEMVKRIVESWARLNDEFSHIGRMTTITEEQVYQGYLASKILESV